MVFFYVLLDQDNTIHCYNVCPLIQEETTLIVEAKNSPIKRGGYLRLKTHLERIINGKEN